jgi:hypothetical protein
MNHWWEPIGRLVPDAGFLQPHQEQAARRLFQDANARGAVLEMHHEVQRDPRGGDDGDAE